MVLSHQFTSISTYLYLTKPNLIESLAFPVVAVTARGLASVRLQQ